MQFGTRIAGIHIVGPNIVRTRIVGNHDASTRARTGNGTTGHELAETRQDLMT
jgi:hypothetical protein